MAATRALVAGTARALGGGVVPGRLGRAALPLTSAATRPDISPSRRPMSGSTGQRPSPAGVQGVGGDAEAEIFVSGEVGVMEAAVGEEGKELGFGFSAGGMLFPYLIGVVDSLRTEGIMTDRTKVAGSSAGSIVAAASASGLSMDEVMEACLELAHDYRQNGTRGRMGPSLQTCLESVLPDDIHERCSFVSHIGVTKLLPYPKHQLLNQYSSKDDLIRAVLTSCHIPWYFNGSFCTTFRGSLYYDGGLTDLIPVPGEVDTAIKVSCFPSKRIKAATNIAVSPDSFDDDFPYTMGELISWAFEPAEEEMLIELYTRGQHNARAWAQAGCPSGFDLQEEQVLEK